MNSQALRTHPPRLVGLLARGGAVLLLCLATTAVMADITVVRSRTLPVNGRTIQEIRVARQPGSRTVIRAVVVTNGPTAGTTSLLTAVADVNNWPDPNATEPVFVVVIASGTVFSIGGGCARGNQLDFPFIDGFRPRVLRFVNGTPTVITPAIAGAEQFDSAECAVSGDGTRTFFIFSNRSVQRLWFFMDAGGANDLSNPQVTFSSVRTPFAGGLRPAISVVPGTARKVALLYMQTNGQSRWLQYDIDAFNVDFNCPVGQQTPPPTGFTIPRGARVANRHAIADFDGDGNFEIARVSPAAPRGGSCGTLPVATPIGPVAGSAFPFSEPNKIFDPYSGITAVVGLSYAYILPSGLSYSVPGPLSVGGSYAGCALEGPESVGEAMVYTAAPFSTRLGCLQTKDGQVPLTTDGMRRSGFEDDLFFYGASCN